MFGAHLRITALRAPQGPGVELLEYLAPRTGRPMPGDTQANDDWYWQINTLRRATPTRACARSLRIRPAGPHRSTDAQLIVRDPDGHALLLRDSADLEGTLMTHPMRTRTSSSSAAASPA